MAQGHSHPCPLPRWARGLTPVPPSPAVPGGEQDLLVPIHGHGADILLVLPGFQDGLPLAQVPHLELSTIITRGQEVLIDGQHAVEGRTVQSRQRCEAASLGDLGGVRAQPQRATYLWALAMRVSSRPSSTVRMWMALSLDTVRSPGAGAQHGHPSIPSPSPPRPRALTLPIRGEGDVPAGLEVVPRGPELLGVPRQAGVAVPAGSGGQED